MPFRFTAFSVGSGKTAAHKKAAHPCAALSNPFNNNY